MKRYELKFVCDERAHARLLAELRMLPDCLAVAHPPRIVQSIYFDTGDRTALLDNLAGISRRQKLRFRWYGAQTKAVVGQLELKRRRAELGDKLVQPLAVAFDVDGTSRTAFTSALRAASPIEWRARLDGREPVVWIRYQREYLATPDEAVRVTVDRAFTAFELRMGWTLTPRDRVPLPRVLIVEVKAGLEHSDRLRAVAGALGLPRSKCSKFVWASAPREAPTPSRIF